MVVEQVVVTTLSLAEAFAKAEGYMGARGYVVRRQAERAFPMMGGGEAATLEMERVWKGRARRLRLGEELRMGYDRGRLSIAVSSQAGGAWGRGAMQARAGRKEKLEERMLMAEVEGLTELLGHGRSGEARYEEWDAVEGEMTGRIRKLEVRNWIAMGVVLAIVLGMIGLAVVAAMLGGR